MELWNGDEPIVYCLVVSTYPSEKYESQLGLVFPISGKIENVPNHQPNNILGSIIVYNTIIIDQQKFQHCLHGQTYGPWENRQMLGT
jgi:hypothetical protein